MDKVTFFVVNHTHWDREWQKTFHEYRTRLIKFMDELIETLEKDDTFTNFLLDGQTSLIEDYLSIKPKTYMKIKSLIEQKRLWIGPWYVQPDEFLPSGESLIRNLLIGEQISREFGNKLNIGYLPDSFGQSRFIPQILNQFNIDTVIAMRGFDKEEIQRNEFIWEGTSDSRVLCSVLWAGYNNGSQLTENLDSTDQWIRFNLDQLKEGSCQNHILLLAGSDQATVKKYMPGLIEKLNKKYASNNFEFRLASLEEYVAHVKENLHNASRFTGDFRKPQLQRVHLSIAGTRTDFKQENYNVQTKLEKILEPISVFGWTFGDRYEQELITHCWKKVVQNHAHDSICNVCVDESHKDMLNRITEANLNADALIKARINNLQEKINFQKSSHMRPIVVFNFNSHPVHEYVEVEIDRYKPFLLMDNRGNEIPYEIVDEKVVNLKEYRLWLKENPDDFVTRTKILFYAEVGGLGYKTFYIKEISNEKEKMPNSQLMESRLVVDKNSISNEYVKIYANTDGTISIFNKQTGKKVENIFYVTDEGNAGDSYDYSPPYVDECIDSRNFEAVIETRKINSFEAEMKIVQTCMVNKETNLQNRSDEKVPMQIEKRFTINDQSKYCDLKVTIDHSAINHRVSLCVPQFTSNSHFREGSFGDVETDNLVTPVDSLKKGWKELYYPVYSTQRYVYDKNSQLAIFNKGVPSYEIKNGTDLKIHLLTTMDYMGKEDLLYRPGRRSGAKIYTPDSLLLGKMDFHFRLMLFNHVEEIYVMSDKFQNPLFGKYFHKPNCQGFIADELETFTINNDSVSTSALMKCQFDDGMIWRIKNMTSDSINTVEVKYNNNLYSFISEVNLLEERIENDRILEEQKADYVGEEYEGSGELIKTGTMRIQNVKPNEIINLKFQRNS